MPSVVVERCGGVIEIILNRPEILNAVNRETIAALADAVAGAAQQHDPGGAAPARIFAAAAISRCSPS